jgi:hypothetical protein
MKIIRKGRGRDRGIHDVIYNNGNVIQIDPLSATTVNKLPVRRDNRVLTLLMNEALTYYTPNYVCGVVYGNAKYPTQSTNIVRGNYMVDFFGVDQEQKVRDAFKSARWKAPVDAVATLEVYGMTPDSAIDLMLDGIFPEIKLTLRDKTGRWLADEKYSYERIEMKMQDNKPDEVLVTLSPSQLERNLPSLKYKRPRLESIVLQHAMTRRITRVS